MRTIFVFFYELDYLWSVCFMVILKCWNYCITAIKKSYWNCLTIFNNIIWQSIIFFTCLPYSKSFTKIFHQFKKRQILPNCFVREIFNFRRLSHWCFLCFRVPALITKKFILRNWFDDYMPNYYLLGFLS